MSSLSVNIVGNYTTARKHVEKKNTSVKMIVVKFKKMSTKRCSAKDLEVFLRIVFRVSNFIGTETINKSSKDHSLKKTPSS